MIRALTIVAAVVSLAATASAQPAPRSDANFAFGGATTNATNATDVLAPTLGPIIRGAGLDLFGLTQELEFAQAALGNIDSDRDVFWLWLGTNNLLASIVGSASDPTIIPDPSAAPTEIAAALEKLYTQFGARVFVVPNLMLLGNLPIFNGGDPAGNPDINGLTFAQNSILAATLAQFQASHPDATVIPLDVQSLFLGLPALFTESVAPCYTQTMPPAGDDCEGFLYADDIHLSSAAAGYVADLAKDALAGIDVRRIVTLGDSFSDTGMLFNTTLRVLGPEFAFPAPPNFAGRFSDGPNVIDQLEDSLTDLELSTTFFAQPFRGTFGNTTTEFPGPVSVIIPARIELDESTCTGPVVIKAGSFSCLYLPDHVDDGVRSLTSCIESRGWFPLWHYDMAGTQVETSSVRVLSPGTPDLDLDLFYY